jgi:hypothetical protein
MFFTGAGTGSIEMTNIDKRRSPRRPIRYTAWVALPEKSLIGCVLNDVSDHGARLDVENSADLPDHFVLLLSNRGTPKRNCKVVWRGDNQLGVEFEKPLAHAEKNRALLKIEATVAPMVPTPSDEDEQVQEPI